MRVVGTTKFFLQKAILGGWLQKSTMTLTNTLTKVDVKR